MTKPSKRHRHQHVHRVCRATGLRATPRIALGFALAWLLCACSTAPVVAPSEFPAPVLRKIDLSVGLVIDTALRTHVHVDKPPRGPTQEVQVGAASEALFREFLGAQFRQVEVLQARPASQPARPGLQAVLHPVIEDVQIASPRTDKDEFHEAWIKYRLQLLTPGGERITAWSIAAYGKHRGPAIGNSNASLTAAVREAMRDAAAGMALVFRDGQALRQRVRGASPRAAGETP